MEDSYLEARKRERRTKAFITLRNRLFLWSAVILAGMLYINFLSSGSQDNSLHFDNSNLYRSEDVADNRNPKPYINVQSSKLYGSIEAPRGRISALVDNKKNKVEARWAILKENQPATAIVLSRDEDGKIIASNSVRAFPAADMDGDMDVDEEDMSRFEDHPFDIDLNGRIDKEDNKKMRSWVGWDSIKK